MYPRSRRRKYMFVCGPYRVCDIANNFAHPILCAPKVTRAILNAGKYDSVYYAC